MRIRENPYSLIFCAETEAITWRCSIKKEGFLKILKNLKENPCAIVTRMLKACNFIKKRSQHKCFPGNFASI